MVYKLLLIIYLSIFVNSGVLVQNNAQKVLTQNDFNVNLPKGFYHILADTTHKLTLNDVINKKQDWDKADADLMKNNVANPKATYWMRINASSSTEIDPNIFIEFVDSHIDELSFYIKGKEGYKEIKTGSKELFSSKPLFYKNYLFDVGKLSKNGTETFYVKIKSSNRTTNAFKFHDPNSLVRLIVFEYIGFGIFYGIILIVLIYNISFLIFTRQLTYLYYILYLLGCLLLFTTEDGLGFQFLWPHMPVLNQFFFNYAPIFVLISFYAYAKRFLDFQKHYPTINSIIFTSILLYVIYFITCELVLKIKASYWAYIIPYGIIYYGALIVYKRGNKIAVYFIIAHFFIAFGLIFLALRKSGIDFLIGALTVYSINIGFIIEIILLTYATGEKIRLYEIKKIKAQNRLVKELQKKEKIQKKLVAQLKENEELKDKINKELETEVEKRAFKIIAQNKIIAEKNEELQEANARLSHQALEILEINKLLDHDNQILKHDFEEVSRARILLKQVSYEEFRLAYPDKLACDQFLDNVKWKNGYKCQKCGYTKYCQGKTLLSRRCTKCRYEESPTANTIFNKLKFPIEKAFYMVFVVYQHDGHFSSQEMSNLLGIRQSTCWSFMQKINLAILRAKKSKSYYENAGWEIIVLDFDTQQSQKPANNILTSP